jgi:hypothetical protein
VRSRCRGAGHILFSPVTLSDHDDLCLFGLAPMTVLPDRERRGTVIIIFKTVLLRSTVIISFSDPAAPATAPPATAQFNPATARIIQGRPNVRRLAELTSSVRTRCDERRERYTSGGERNRRMASCVGRVSELDCRLDTTSGDRCRTGQTQGNGGHPERNR